MTSLQLRRNYLLGKDNTVDAIDLPYFGATTGTGTAGLVATRVVFQAERGESGEG